MSVLRLMTLCLISATALTTINCTDASDPVSPVEPQFAKPIKPPPAPPVELLEYYIFQDDQGKNFVHIVATGEVPMVNLNVVQDYIFNGIRDDDYSIFYEYTTFAPDPVSLSELLASGAGEIDPVTGKWHVDIPWNGEMYYMDYSNPDNPFRMDTYFPDFPHVGLGGGTADPYAFDIRFQKENGDYIAGYQPQGIILGGEESYAAEMAQPAQTAFHSEVETIYSYATFAGDPGVPVFIEEIIVDESSLTCSMRTITERIDRVKVTRQVAEVSARAQVIVSTGEGDPLPSAWIDVMFASATDGSDGPELLDTFTATHGSESWAAGYTLSAQFEPAQPIFDLRIAVPYVYADMTESGPINVYTPSSNKEVGFSTLHPQGITAPGTFPIAITEPFTVNCGN